MIPLWTTTRPPVAVGVRVGILLGRPAVSRPARVADAERARERALTETPSSILSRPAARRHVSVPSLRTAMPAES